MNIAGKNGSSRVKVLSTNHIGIPCNNLDRAVAFYTEFLGFEVDGLFLARNNSFFRGSNLPEGLGLESKGAACDYAEYAALHLHARPDQPVPELNYVVLHSGRAEIVLSQRPVPITNAPFIHDGLNHHAFWISAAGMDELVALKQQPDSPVRFHFGPVVRWPIGRTIYLWDSEDNYLELMSNEDLSTKYG